MLELAEDPKCEFYYSPLHVVQYCRFLERLQHVESGNWETTQVNEDGSVNPYIILEPWQIWIESAVQGFRRRINHTRLVTVALTVVPRKSAKSLATAGAALFDLCCSGQRGPQVTIAAANQKQADRVFSPISRFIQNDADLKDQYDLIVTKDEIRCAQNSGVIMKLTMHGERQDGLNPSLAIFEEAHEGHVDVYNVVRSSFGARPNALIRMITTAGRNPDGPAWNLIEQAMAMASGKHETDAFFAAIYTLDREDYIDEESNGVRWDRLLTDDALVVKANPMFGVSLMPYMLEEDREEAKRSPSNKAEYARTRFNIWTNAGHLAVDPAAWKACHDKTMDLASFEGQRCWIGVDLASKQDMCAIGLVFELPNDDIAVFAEYYLPEASKLANDANWADLVHAWSEAGHLHITPGVTADFKTIREAVIAYSKFFEVAIIAVDDYQANWLVGELWGEDRPVQTFPNKASTMTGTTDDILARIASKTIRHDGNPVMAWNFTNAEVERKDNGSIMFRKGKDPMRKIDGVAALAMANANRLEERKPGQNVSVPSPYASRGIIGFDDIAGQ